MTNAGFEVRTNSNDIVLAIPSWENLPVEGVVELGLRKSFKIVSPGSSLRRRVAYSLAIVRLILVPVIFLAVYYLFEMGLIVDRIVSVDAPVARLAEQASVEMLDARRAERNYFLLRDPEYLKTNQESLARVKQALEEIRRSCTRRTVCHPAGAAKT